MPGKKRRISIVTGKSCQPSKKAKQNTPAPLTRRVRHVPRVVDLEPLHKLRDQEENERKTPPYDHTLVPFEPPRSRPTRHSAATVCSLKLTSRRPSM